MVFVPSVNVSLRSCCSVASVSGLNSSEFIYSARQWRRCSISGVNPVLYCPSAVSGVMRSMLVTIIPPFPILASKMVARRRLLTKLSMVSTIGLAPGMESICMALLRFIMLHHCQSVCFSVGKLRSAGCWWLMSSPIEPACFGKCTGLQNTGRNFPSMPLVCFGGSDSMILPPFFAVSIALFMSDVIYWAEIWD